MAEPRQAHVLISGLRSDDLAVRRRDTVERAMRAGATHLIIDTRGVTGVAPEFDDVINWTGRRLWARQGSLILRAPASERSVPEPA